MDPKYGVLVHGAGWVSTQHIAAFRRHPATRVVAISSRKLESARRRAAEASLEDVGLYDDLDRALEHPGVDIVSVCTPQHVHASNVIAAARAGKHVVIEKPVANSRAELIAMRDAVRAAGVRTVVSFVLRWNPLFRILKSMIADGAIGDVYSVETDYLHDFGSGWSGFDDARRAEQGVSAMLVGGCHAIDALRWFAAPGEHEAARPLEVFAWKGGHRKGTGLEYDVTTGEWQGGAPPLEYDGLEVALVRLEGGVVGKVSVNFDCIMPYRFPLRVFGSRGTIWDHRVWSSKYAGQTDWVEIPAVQPDSGDVRHHPFQAQMDHFVDCLERGVPSHCDLDDACLTHEVVFAILESYREGRPIRIPTPE